jgi:glyoxylase-like metal-dependent hydrolase (beta-lactamase superfamily II)
MGNSIRLGNVEITRLEDFSHEVPFPPNVQFAEYDEGNWNEHVSIIPHFDWNADHSCRTMSYQTWVLRSGGRTMLVDTSVGNHKQRPGAPILHDLDTNYLARLAELGTQPEDVDLVIVTHIHVDHVGWNTRLVDGTWVPTFPNARYLLPRPDVVFWDPINAECWDRRGAKSMMGVFEDSITPIIEASLVDVWEDSYVIDENLRLAPAPGHTPGNAVLYLESGEDCGIFIGDAAHSPIQIALPAWNSRFCEDPFRAAASRRKAFGWAAENNALVFACHFGGDHAAEVVETPTGFDVRKWRALTQT